MVRTTQTEKRLCSYLLHFAAPALLLHQEKGIVLAWNPPAIQHFQGAIQRGTRVCLAGTSVPPELEMKKRYRLVLKEDRIECEEPSENDPLIFTLLPAQNGYTFLVGEHVATATQAFSITEAFCVPGSFFSYEHHLIDDRRIFSSPECLERLQIHSKTNDVTVTNWLELIHEEDRDRFKNIREHALREGGDYRLQYRICPAPGLAIEVIDFCGVIQGKDMWPHLAGIIIIADQLRETLEGIEKSCLVGRFVGGMIHDFRNLLGGIQNMLEWCLARSTLEPHVTKALSNTINYTEQATDLIRCFMRLFEGKQNQPGSTIDLVSLLKDVEELIKHYISPAIEIRIDCPKEIPPIPGERSRLLDALLNLCLNACEAMVEKGSCLKISVEYLPPQPQDYEGKVQIHVRDDGCGMTQEQCRSVFQEFYSTKKEGTGLGLWMVQETIHSMNGTIHVRSKLGEGTTFTICLPVPPPEEGSRPDKDTAATLPLRFQDIDLCEGKTVLLIEDDPLMRNGILAWLEAINIHVITATNGREGLMLFERHADEIDLIIQDFILPGVRGEVLLETFHRSAPHIPVIICSGFPDGHDSERLKEMGAYEFLPKPFKMEQLVNLLKTIFRSQ